EEREARMRALRDAIAEDERRKIEEAARPAPAPAEPAAAAQDPVPAPAPPKTRAEIEMDLRQKELEELRQIEEEEKKKAEEAENLRQDSAPPPDAVFRRPSAGDDEGEETFSARLKRQAKAAPAPRRTPDVGRRGGRITVSQAINNDFERDRG